MQQREIATVRVTLILSFVFISIACLAQPRSGNLVIITLDGFRWQELFGGADPDILFNKSKLRARSSRAHVNASSGNACFVFETGRRSRYLCKG